MRGAHPPPVQAATGQTPAGAAPSGD